MSADRIEIFDEGSQIRILCNGSISTIISGPLGTRIEDAVIGAIRQQARDIAELEIDVAGLRSSEAVFKNYCDQLRANLAAAVAARDWQVEATKAAIDACNQATTTGLAAVAERDMLSELAQRRERQLSVALNEVEKLRAFKQAIDSAPVVAVASEIL